MHLLYIDYLAINGSQLFNVGHMSPNDCKPIMTTQIHFVMRRIMKTILIGKAYYFNAEANQIYRVLTMSAPFI